MSAGGPEVSVDGVGFGNAEVAVVDEGLLPVTAGGGQVAGGPMGSGKAIVGADLFVPVAEFGC